MKKAKEKEIVVLPPRETATVNDSSSVDQFISQAIQSNVPVETMERLFALRSQVLAEKAKAAYVQALATFQSNCPVIKKSKKVLNKDGSVRYMFAPIESIIDQIKKPLAESDLSYRWETKQENGSVRAICIITHVLGHSESSDFDIPVDKEGFMTAPQKTASALTFAKRYSLCNALGISTGDEDTDATDVKNEPNVKSDKAKIVFLLRQLGKNTKTKESIESEIVKMTQLELKDENFGEIVSRLELLVTESQQYENPKV